jgi:hypothetical protein
MNKMLSRGHLSALGQRTPESPGQVRAKPASNPAGAVDGGAASPFHTERARPAATDPQ